VLGLGKAQGYRFLVGALTETPEPPSDSALVARMAAGDRSAVAALYTRHVRSLFALARSMLKSHQEAEDLIHDVFLEAWKRSADYSEERGTVRAWLFMRARSRALDRIKSAGRSLTVLTESESTPVAFAAGDQRRLHELLSKMPEVQQQVLMLGYFEGLSTAEIAERLGIPAGTVKSRTRAALGSLRNMLGSTSE
jgi:RNA polymerase sigma-70 factor, ECF subfamily